MTSAFFDFDPLSVLDEPEPWWDEEDGWFDSRDEQEAREESERGPAE